MGYSAKELISMAEASKGKRSTWEGGWKEQLFFTQPHQNVTSPGVKLPSDLYDSTGIYYSNDCASGICGYLTNPSSRWFEYEMKEAELNQDNEVKTYLKECTDVVYGVLGNSNFYQKIRALYGKLVRIGSPVLYSEEDPKEIVRFYTMGHLECAFEEDDREVVDTMFRWRDYTASQAFKKWGRACGPTAMKMIQDKKGHEKIQYLHAVLPRYDRDVSKTDNKNMPWASYWVCIQDQKIIDEKGYPEFPFQVPRWDKNEDSPYSYCPAAYALADLKTLNDNDGNIIQGQKLAIKPPLVVPHDGYVLPITQKAGGLNYKISGPSGDKIETLNNGGNLPLAEDLNEKRRERVKRAFFVDLFRQFEDDPTKTATEINIRNNQNMLLLGPSIGNIMTDALSPALFRVYMICGRAGLLPALPEKLKGRQFTVKYTSQLARAQKMAQLNGLSNTITSITSIITINPESGDVVDFDEAIREIAEINGANPKLTRDKTMVENRRNVRMQQEQQAMQMQAMLQMAQVAKTGAEASDKFQSAQQPRGGK